MEERNNNTLFYILGALLVIAIAAGVFFGIKSTKKAREAEKTLLQLDSLEQVKLGLEEEVVHLTQQYEMVGIENDSLKGSLENAREILEKKDAQLAWARRQSRRDINSLKEEISALQTTKTDLMATIDNLQQENSSLKQQNEELNAKVETFTRENSNLQNQVGELTRAKELLEAKSAQLANSAFKASGMQIDVSRKNDKATIKSKKVRKFNVGFDLVDVPQEYQGPQNVYLYITNANGVPIAGTKDKVKVGVGNQALVIEPHEAKKVNLTASQRLEFNYEVPEKLRPGYYVISLYSDKGILGSSLFKLV